MSACSSSQQYHEDLDSLIFWLKTFPEFNCDYDESLDCETLLNQTDVAKYVVFEYVFKFFTFHYLVSLTINTHL